MDPCHESVELEVVDGPGRDLGKARDAYSSGDVEASKNAHDVGLVGYPVGGDSKEEHAGEGGKYVKSLVYGGLDGIITTFAVVAAVAGGALSTNVVLILGFANLVADGLSMGLGDYLSSQAEDQFVRHEMKREKWEMDNYMEGEKREMIEKYMEYGFTKEHATEVIEICANYPDFFLDNMLVHELGLMPPDDNDSPWKNGVVTFLAFCLFGFVPLTAYIILPPLDVDSNITFAVSCVLTALTMFGLGVVKANFTNQSKVKSGSLMLMNGGIAAAASYAIGYVFSVALGEQ
ncbi:hypothetical protein CYMTET_13975 [Cymbomonas tetramitiformis]|uniref:Uncharacterized protein n=1 Tax=Cymbomonas tetramitiformis TaxID=36881 RepID=A0AAE0GHG0_9CHLO|nr:hypothetical protein CYMTET_13975 [Cymbomonas tetramitiformis]